MSIDKTEAIVIRTVDFSETSKVATFFTRDLGKVSVLAKGARRLKSSFEVALDLLNVCSISVLRKPAAGLDLLTEAMLLERFTGLRRDLPSLYAAYYIAELLDNLTQIHDPHPGLYEAALDALRRLGPATDRLYLLGRFVLLLLKEIGYQPNLEQCSGCGSIVPLGRTMAFSVEAGGLLCGGCAKGRPSRQVQGGTVQSLRAMLAENANARIALNRTTQREIWSLLSGSIAHLIGRQPKTASLLQW